MEGNPSTADLPGNLGQTAEKHERPIKTSGPVWGFRRPGNPERKENLEMAVKWGILLRTREYVVGI